MQVKKGSTDITVYFHLRDSSNGTSKTGLVYNSSGAVASYTRSRSSCTTITLASLSSPSAAHSDGGFIEVDGTNAKGLYRLDVPDAAFAAGADEVIIHIGFTGVFEESLAIELVDERPGNLKDDAITAAKIASDAITAAKIAADAIGSSEFAQAAADKIWASATRALTDKNGFSLSSAGILDIWAALTANLTTVGSIGKLLVDDIDAKISSRSDHSAADVWSVASRALTDKSDFALSTAARAAIVDEVWDELIAEHLGTGSTGLKLNNASAPTKEEIADQVWDELQIGHRSSGSFGSYLDSKVSESGGGATPQTIAAAVLNEQLSDHISAGSVGEKLYAIRARVPLSPWTKQDLEKHFELLDKIAQAIDALPKTSQQLYQLSANIQSTSSSLRSDLSNLNQLVTEHLNQPLEFPTAPLQKLEHDVVLLSNQLANLSSSVRDLAQSVSNLLSRKIDFAPVLSELAAVSKSLEALSLHEKTEGEEVKMVIEQLATVLNKIENMPFDTLLKFLKAMTIASLPTEMIRELLDAEFKNPV